MNIEMAKVLFLDLETTGFHPERDLILEVGAILYDLKADREICHHHSMPSDPLGDEETLRFRPMDVFVYKMHTESGLFARRLQTAPTTLGETERELLNLVSGYFFRGECMLAGFSVGFDRSFLKQQMPVLEGFLSHRVIDASVLKSLSKAYGKEWPKKEPAHRSLEDCREAIEVVKLFRSAIESVEPPA